jgi:hypothetical protein
MFLGYTRAFNLKETHFYYQQQKCESAITNLSYADLHFILIADNPRILCKHAGFLCKDATSASFHWRESLPPFPLHQIGTN